MEQEYQSEIIAALERLHNILASGRTYDFNNDYDLADSQEVGRLIEKIKKEMTQFKPGDKVTYNSHLKPERGIVKSCQGGTVFVVFNCGEDWDNYSNYTAAACRAGALKKGW